MCVLNNLMVAQTYTYCLISPLLSCLRFFFDDTATTEIYTYLPTLSLHDALPILPLPVRPRRQDQQGHLLGPLPQQAGASPPLRQSIRADRRDRKSTRLNSSH